MEKSRTSISSTIAEATQHAVTTFVPQRNSPKETRKVRKTERITISQLFHKASKLKSVLDSLCQIELQISPLAIIVRLASP